VFSSCSPPTWHDPAPRVPAHGVHLNYRNDCVIISRALISSPQRGYMVHASRASTASAPAPFSARHFLIGRSAIKNARNSPEINALDFSNRPIKACLRAPFPRVSRPKYHHLPETYRGSLITNHQSLLTNHAFLIASRQILKIRLTPTQQTRKLFLIASFSASSAPASLLTGPKSPIAPFLTATHPNSEILQPHESKRETIF